SSSLFSAYLNISFSGCTFQNGYSFNNNGGAITTFGSLTVSNCSFFNNRCSGNGGAIASFSNVPSITMTNVTNCLFAGNQAGNNGGAIIYELQPTLIENCTFTANHAANEGGAIAGPFASDTPGASAALLNDTIFGNRSGSIGGGVSFTTHQTSTYIR